MKSSLLTLVLALSGVLALTDSKAKSTSLAYSNDQEERIILTPFNLAGVPIRINEAAAENSVGASWVELSVTNLSSEEFKGICVRIFIADSAGKLIKVKDGFSGDKVAAGQTEKISTQIRGTLKHPMLSFVTVRKVISNSGVWNVAESALEAAIRSKLNHQSESILNVDFQANVTTNDDDRIKIFELVLADILNDDKKAERLPNLSRVIILRDGVNFDLPQLARASLVAMNQQEIQDIAEREQRVIYLRYEPLTSEGSRVFAKIALRDARARGSGIHVPYKFTFLFTCVRENERWVIEKSTGYAQS